MTILYHVLAFLSGAAFALYAVLGLAVAISG